MADFMREMNLGFYFLMNVDTSPFETVNTSTTNFLFFFFNLSILDLMMSSFSVRVGGRIHRPDLRVMYIYMLTNNLFFYYLNINKRFFLLYMNLSVLYDFHVFSNWYTLTSTKWNSRSFSGLTRPVHCNFLFYVVLRSVIFWW